MNPTSPVDLRDVPETMLFTLHNRAAEARRPGGFLSDPECLRIYDAIDYEFERNFGTPDTSHPMRSRLFDDAIRPWMAEHPGGTVVELGCGLETQFARVDDGRVRWVCVDLPASLAVRERFLAPGPRCRHVAASALDPRWLDEIDGRRGVFVSAQGLFMYFQEDQVRQLVVRIVERFAEVELMFDTVPRWVSRTSLGRGFSKTPHYTAPPMPWGVGQDELPSLLRRWSRRVGLVRTQPYGFWRGPGLLLLALSTHVPWFRDIAPAIAHVTSTGEGR